MTVVSSLSHAEYSFANECEKEIPEFGTAGYKVCMSESSQQEVMRAYKKWLKALGAKSDKSWLSIAKENQKTWISYKNSSRSYVAVSSEGDMSDSLLYCKLDFNKSRVVILERYIKMFEK